MLQNPELIDERGNGSRTAAEMDSLPGL